MITQDEAIALAQEVGALIFKDGHSMTPTFTVGLSYEKLTELCNMVRREALLEAARDFYTTEQARQMAQEVGALMFLDTVGLPNAELTALCNKVRTQTLLEAINLARGETWANHSADVVLEKLRRMAGDQVLA